MEKRYKWIVFDLNGVIAQMFFGPNQFVELDRMKIDVTRLAGMFKSKEYREYMQGNLAEVDLLAAYILQESLPLNVEQFQKIMKKYVYEVPGMVKLAQELKHTYQLALATNDGGEWIGHKVQKLGLDKSFDEVVSSNVLHCLKPEERFYLGMLKQLKANPSECLFIDDKARNCEAAEALGIDSLVFESMEQLVRDLEGMGVKF